MQRVSLFDQSEHSSTSLTCRAGWRLVEKLYVHTFRIWTFDLNFDTNTIVHMRLKPWNVQRQINLKMNFHFSQIFKKSATISQLYSKLQTLN